MLLNAGMRMNEAASKQSLTLTRFAIHQRAYPAAIVADRND
jgi:hypothetical protein